MEIQYLAKDFYILQALGATARLEPFRHSHQRWRRDYQDYFDVFTERFARTLYDYLCLIVFGEARHASNCAGYYYEDWPVSHIDGRSNAYSYATDYSPASFLPKAAQLFLAGNWEESYGGRAWARIAEAAMLYGKVPDVVFIDHAIDLSHNSGLCFDKDEAGIFTCYFAESYREFLDMKATMPPEVYIPGLRCSHHVARLVRRAINLGIVGFLPPQASIVYTDAVNTLLRREPIDWGECIIDSDLVPVAVHCSRCYDWVNKMDAYDDEYGGYLCQDCYYHDDEEEDYEEEEEEDYGYTYDSDYFASEDTRPNIGGSATAA